MSSKMTYNNLNSRRKEKEKGGGTPPMTTASMIRRRKKAVQTSSHNLIIPGSTFRKKENPQYLESHTKNDKYLSYSKKIDAAAASSSEDESAIHSRCIFGTVGDNDSLNWDITHGERYGRDSVHQTNDVDPSSIAQQNCHSSRRRKMYGENKIDDSTNKGTTTSPREVQAKRKFTTSSDDRKDICMSISSDDDQEDEKFIKIPLKRLAHQTRVYNRKDHRPKLRYGIKTNVMTLTFNKSEDIFVGRTEKILINMGETEELINYFANYEEMPPLVAGANLDSCLFFRAKVDEPSFLRGGTRIDCFVLEFEDDAKFLNLMLMMERNGIHSFSAQRHNIEDYAKDLIADNNGITQDKIMNCNNNNSAIKNKEVIDLCDGIIEVSNNNDLITTNHIILVVDSSSSMKTNDFTMKNSSGQEINISRWEAVCKYLERFLVDQITNREQGEDEKENEDKYVAAVANKVLSVIVSNDVNNGALISLMPLVDYRKVQNELDLALKSWTPGGGVDVSMGFICARKLSNWIRPAPARYSGGYRLPTMEEVTEQNTSLFFLSDGGPTLARSFPKVNPHIQAIKDLHGTDKFLLHFVCMSKEGETCLKSLAKRYNGSFNQPILDLNKDHIIINRRQTQISNKNDEETEEEDIEELAVKSPHMLIQERQNLAEESGQVISLLYTPDKIKELRTTTKTQKGEDGNKLKEKKRTNSNGDKKSNALFSAKQQREDEDQTNSSYTFREEDFVMRKQEFELRKEQEVRQKKNDELEMESKQLTIREKKADLYFKLQDKGWDDSRILRIYPDLKEFTK